MTGESLKLEKLVGIIGLLLAIAAAFVTIPYIALLLLMAGLIVGLSIAREDHVRVIVSALALATFAHLFDAVPEAGKYLSAIVGNVAILAGGGALMVIGRNLWARFNPALNASPKAATTAG